MLDLDYINYAYLIPRVIHRLWKAIYRLRLGYISYMQTTPKLCTTITKLCMAIFGLCRLYIGLYLGLYLGVVGYAWLYLGYIGYT